jgi:hypothetical protein
VIKLLKIVGLTFMFVGLLLAMIGLIVIGNQLPQERVYDCGMAEWHPDIPPKVREECRRLRSAKIV